MYCYSVGDEEEGWLSEEYCFQSSSGSLFPDRRVIFAAVGDLGIRRESHKTVKQLLLFAERLRTRRMAGHWKGDERSEREDRESGSVTRGREGRRAAGIDVLGLDLILHLGDFAYPNGNTKWSVLLPEYGPLKQKTWDLMMDMLVPLAARVPYMTIPGNHEYFPYDFGVHSYLLRFHMPASPLLPSHPSSPSLPFLHSSLPSTNLSPSFGSALSTSAHMSYYSFHYLSIHFIALNSEESLDPESPQMTWLLSDLDELQDRSDIDWVILQIHRPLYRFND